jgi:hypothetical protein
MPTLFDFSSLLHRQAKHIEKKNFEKDKECEHPGCGKESRIQIRRQQILRASSNFSLSAKSFLISY